MQMIMIFLNTFFQLYMSLIFAFQEVLHAIFQLSLYKRKLDSVTAQYNYITSLFERRKNTMISSYYANELEL